MIGAMLHLPLRKLALALALSPALSAAAHAAPTVQGSCDQVVELIAPGFSTSTIVALSDDGAVACGTAFANIGTPAQAGVAVRWSSVDGYLRLPPRSTGGSILARDVSGDGVYIVGPATTPGGLPTGGSLRWSVAGGYEVIDTLGYAPVATDEDGDAIALARDIAGSGCSSALWTPAGVQPIDNAGMRDVCATDVSGDGLVVVGWMRSSGTSARRAFRWTQASGLVDLGPTWPTSEAAGVSDDGSVVVGRGAPPSAGGAFRAFRWTVGGGMEALEGPADTTFSAAEAVSSDGAVVVGSYAVDPGPGRAARWSGGAHEVVVPAPPAAGLTQALDVSDDGSLCAVRVSLSTGTRSYAARLSPLGETYCDAVPNSAGCTAVLDVAGSPVVADDDLRLIARRLPPARFGFFLTSRDADSMPIAGSEGVLCLGGTVGRFVAPGQILNSGAAGSFALDVALASLPLPGGVVQPGETWRFQAWHRDLDPGGAQTSNLSTAVAVTFE